MSIQDNSGTPHRHGSAYDRGAADSYYRRGRRPHYFKGGTYTSDEVTREDMTEEEIKEYHRGFDENEANGDHKDWGRDEYDADPADAEEEDEDDAA